MTTQGQRAAPSLHLPDEPTAQRERWYAAVLDGADLAQVLLGDDGVVDWLWSRWRVLESSGFTAARFADLVLAYRRELWLWFAGERTWDQCCSGLIGRIGRRLED